ncbi:MAG: methyltransferase domain-containing protein [Candidatus Jordarchaeales archaeon]
MRRSTYGEWYFEEKYKYGKKRRAIQRHYLDALSWADHNVEGGVLDGRGKRALDVGCAYGFVVELLSKLGYDAVGVDVSSYAIRRGRGGRLVVADAENLPFMEESFNLVTCFAVLEHLLEPGKALQETYRVMRPGGVLVATTPNTNAAATVLIHILAREPKKTHPSAKPPSDWVKMVAGAGFKDVKVRPFLLLPTPPTLLQRYFVVEVPLRLASHVEILAVKSC